MCSTDSCGFLLLSLAACVNSAGGRIHAVPRHCKGGSTLSFVCMIPTCAKRGGGVICHCMPIYSGICRSRKYTVLLKLFLRSPDAHYNLGLCKGDQSETYTAVGIGSVYPPEQKC